MRKSIRNVTRLYNVVYRSLFTINGRLSYDRLTDGIIKLAEMVQETRTGEFTLQEIGEFNEACLSDLIIGAFWHYTEHHDGQESKGYRALSELSGIYSPGMETGPEPETGEYSAYSMLADMVPVYGIYNVTFNDGFTVSVNASSENGAIQSVLNSGIVYAPLSAIKSAKLIKRI